MLGKEQTCTYPDLTCACIRYEALLAVQKLMVHNWEYLGRQVDRPAASSNKVVTY